MVHTTPHAVFHHILGDLARAATGCTAGVETREANRKHVKLNREMNLVVLGCSDTTLPFVSHTTQACLVAASDLALQQVLLLLHHQHHTMQPLAMEDTFTMTVVVVVVVVEELVEVQEQHPLHPLWALTHLPCSSLAVLQHGQP